MQDLPIIQEAHDLLLWYLPILQKLPRNCRYTLGARIENGLYDLHAGLIKARYNRERIARLEKLQC